MFHKFDLFFLFGFNITKMHIFCNFFKRRLLLSQTKNDFYWQPILKKLIHLRFWSDGAGLKLRLINVLMLEQCIPLEGIRKMIYTEIMIRRYQWLRVGYKQKFTIVSHRDKNLILSS